MGISLCLNLEKMLLKKIFRKCFEEIHMILLSIFILIGFLSFTIIFHEIYHLHNSGDATGICLGKCYIYNETFAPAGVHWIFNSEEEYDILQKNMKNGEERNAWIFGFSVTTLLFVLYFISKKVYDRN